MSRKVYKTLINKIQPQIIDIRHQIISMKDINLLSFFSLTIEKAFYPNKIQKLFTQIDEIYKDLNQLRGKVKSALNTYVIVSTTEELESQNEDAITLKTEDTKKDKFFSSLLGLLEQINFLEYELSKKDVRNFVDKKNQDISNFRQNSKGQENLNWEDLNIKF